MALQQRTFTVRGVEVPALGYGTWQVEGEAAYEGVLDALALGYRHIDTAVMYGNEEQIGRALAETDVARDDYWLTTKVWKDDAAPDDIRRSAEASVARLGVDRVDLMLLHWPNADVPLKDTIEGFQAIKDAGLTREFGLSNFPSGLLREALSYGDVLTDQIEFHPYLAQDEVRAVLDEHELMLTAYSPFAHGELLQDDVLQDIADEHGATVGQVALAWSIQHPRTAAIPKASSHERRRDTSPRWSSPCAEARSSASIRCAPGSCARRTRRSRPPGTDRPPPLRRASPRADARSRCSTSTPP